MVGDREMRDRRPVVLLTGANGFVGRNVAPVVTANGMIVRRAIRQLSPDADPGADTIIINTIGPRTNWEEALVGVDAVVHLAARVHHPREEHATDIYRSINTDGTLHAWRAPR